MSALRLRTHDSGKAKCRKCAAATCDGQTELRQRPHCIGATTQGIPGMA
jgi:hypothetical protein